MKNETKQTAILSFLYEHSEWVSASTLSQHLGISSRQLRNYIQNMNSESDRPPVIISSPKGYKIVPEEYESRLQSSESDPSGLPKYRRMDILSRLLRNPTGYDIYDLAESLFVSEPTIEADISAIRRWLESFELNIKRNRSSIQLIGKETDKRRMMRMILNRNANNFVIENNLFFMHSHNILQLQNQIKEILHRHKITINDYSLQYITIHVIISVERISLECRMIEEKIGMPEVKKCYFDAAFEIGNLLENLYYIQYGIEEVYYLERLLDSNASFMDTSKVTSSNLGTFVEQEYIDITTRALKHIDDLFFTGNFDEDFFNIFALHIKNLFLRSDKNYAIHNPLKDKIKTTYPLIHDMSVYIAQLLELEYSIKINEDEITYIAFHLGTSFYKLYEDKVTATLLYADYHNQEKNILTMLEQNFGDRMSVKYAVSISNFIQNAYHTDLIISTVEIKLPQPSIIINPFPLKADMEKIRHEIEKQQQMKKKEFFINHILNFFDEKLFKKNMSVPDYWELISQLCQNVIDLEYAKPRFLNDVLDREKMSSTAYFEMAVPHALSQRVNRSFISVVLQETPIRWNYGEENVKVVFLIGIHKKDRRVFSQFYDYLVEMFTEPKNINQLVKSTDYNDFIDTMSKLAENIRY